MSEIICDICFHHCHIPEGMTGKCHARINQNGTNMCGNYGRLTSLAMDPIEKKPFKRFCSGSYILTAGFYGCNLSCPFCQNSMISMADETNANWRYFSVEKLCQIAAEEWNNIGIAFSYNEPLISYEYIRDCFSRLKEKNMKTAIVTNGIVSLEVLKKVLPYTDAMNIDYKGDGECYKKLGGSEEMVRSTIEYVYDKCHLEVTTLLVPGLNCTEKFIAKEAKWLSELNPDIPLHLSRYFPRYKYHAAPTDISFMEKAADIAGKYLKYVYLGNI